MSEINPLLSRLFRLVNATTLLAWLPLLVVPAWVAGRLEWWAGYIAALCALYAYILFLGRRHDGPEGPPRGSFLSLRGVLGLFRSPRATLAGWLHYLAFDLAVGLYIVHDSQLLGVSQLLVLPCLLLTLMFGPTGLLLWWVLRYGFIG